MQVSWIDPEEVASLAEALRPPVPTKASEPATESAQEEAVEPLLTEAAPSTVASEPTVEALDLPAFRQKLQSIREKAIRAGLLTPVSQAPEAEMSPDVSPAESATPAEGGSVPESTIEVVPLQTEQAEVVSEAPAIDELPEPEPTPAVDVFPQTQPLVSVAPTATVKDRLEAFAGWAAQQWGHGDLLVVDEYGDLLWGPPKRSGLVLSTMMAWNAAIRASAQAANGLQQIQQQTLATGESLTIIPCQTRLGLLVIAWVKFPSPANQETTSLREALTSLMDLMVV